MILGRAKVCGDERQPGIYSRAAKTTYGASLMINLNLYLPPTFPLKSMFRVGTGKLSRECRVDLHSLTNMFVLHMFMLPPMGTWPVMPHGFYDL